MKFAAVARLESGVHVIYCFDLMGSKLLAWLSLEGLRIHPLGKHPSLLQMIRDRRNQRVVLEGRCG